MKKILCLLLTLLVAFAVPCGAFAVPCGAFAAQTEKEQNYEIVNTWGNEDEKYTELKIGSSNGYDIHVYATNLVTDPGWSERIGPYRFFVNYTRLGIYAVKGDTKLSFREAYNQNLINLNEVVLLVDGFRYDNTEYDVYPIGDVNQDKVLNVEDVILLQRNLAKEIVLDYNESDWKNFLYKFTVVDCDENYEINLQDVLIMQKLIAKIPVTLP